MRACMCLSLNMCIFMDVYMDVCTTHTRTQTYIHHRESERVIKRMEDSQRQARARAHTHTHTCSCVCVYIYTHIHTHPHPHPHTPSHTCPISPHTNAIGKLGVGIKAHFLICDLYVYSPFLFSITNR